MSGGRQTSLVFQRCLHGECTSVWLPSDHSRRGSVDELGYMELDRRGAELLFQVLTEREEKNGIAIASNHAFSGWTKTFTDPRLCAALVDRLTFNGAIIETATDSYRLAHARKQSAG
jgi:DNA replication protein DnaC